MHAAVMQQPFCLTDWHLRGQSVAARIDGRADDGGKSGVDDHLPANDEKNAKALRVVA